VLNPEPPVSLLQEHSSRALPLLCYQGYADCSLQRGDGGMHEGYTTRLVLAQGTRGEAVESITYLTT